MSLAGLLAVSVSTLGLALALVHPIRYSHAQILTRSDCESPSLVRLIIRTHTLPFYLCSVSLSRSPLWNIIILNLWPSAGSHGYNARRASQFVTRRVSPKTYDNHPSTPPSLSLRRHPGTPLVRNGYRDGEGYMRRRRRTTSCIRPAGPIALQSRRAPRPSPLTSVRPIATRRVHGAILGRSADTISQDMCCGLHHTQFVGRLEDRSRLTPEPSNSPIFPRSHPDPGLEPG